MESRIKKERKEGKKRRGRERRKERLRSSRETTRGGERKCISVKVTHKLSNIKCLSAN
jgi:hypothetical protein